MLGVAAATLLIGCGGSSTADGFQSVATGDTYGEWELFAEYQDGEWTGCLRLDPYDGVERCADPDSGLVEFDNGDGAVFGAVPEGGRLVFEDGGEVALEADRFFVVASDADIRLDD
jgi:hypothetical protein